MMTERHRAAIDELVRLHGNDPKKLALIICGSLATGKARADSDVDLYLVVTDEEFERTRRTTGCFYGTWDPNEFFGIEIDGKIVGLQFLRDAAVRGAEPTRTQFQGAFAEFSHEPEVDELIGKIAVYPEREREKKIKAFYALVKHHRYVGEQAFKLANEYYARRCVTELVFYAGRLVLAHNRVLFPCHKGLFAALERCEELPAGFVDASLRLLNDMTLSTATEYYETVAGYFSQYEYPDQERIGIILEDEWSWFSRTPSIGDW